MSDPRNEHFAEAISRWRQSVDRDGAAAVLRHLEAAVEEEPACVPAYLLMATVLRTKALYGWSARPEEERRRAAEAIDKALALDDGSPDAHALRGLVLVDFKEYAAAEREFGRAVALNPKLADTYAMFAQLFIARGSPRKAMSLIRRARELSADPPPWLATTEALALIMLERLADARALLRATVDSNPSMLAALMLHAAVAAALGFGDEAAAAYSLVSAQEPSFDVGHWLAELRLLNESTRATIEAYLRKAGF